MFYKVWFSNKEERTAGLVVEECALFPNRKVKDMATISHLFPYSEAPKMKKYHVSPAFNTFSEAFEFSPNN